MPIRHCQNCGIKIIVDDDKATVFPFYCDLCHTKSAIVSSVKTGGEPLQAVETKVDPTKSESVCPNCNLILTIKVAEKPIKSRCPECSKDILLLPNGSVRLIEDPDILKFAKRADIKSGSSQTLKPNPKPQVPTSTPKGTPVAKKTDEAPKIAVKMPDSKVVTKQPQPAKPAPTPKPMPKPGEIKKVEVPKVQVKEPKPEPVAATPDPLRVPTKTPAPLKPTTKRFRTSVDLPKAKKANPIVVAVLLLLPIVVGVAGFAAKDGAMKEHLEKLGLMVQKGAKKIFEMMTPNEAPAPPPSQKQETKREEKPFTEDDKAALRQLILEEYRKSLGACLTYWRDDNEQMRAMAENAEKNLQALKAEYTRRTNETPNVAEGEKAALEDFLLKLHQLKLQTRQRMRRVADPAPLQKKVDMLAGKWDEFTAKYEQLYGQKYKIPDEFARPDKDPKAEDQENLDELYRNFVEKEQQLQKEGENASEITKAMYETAKRKFEEAKKAYEDRYKEAYEPPK